MLKVIATLRLYNFKNRILHSEQLDLLSYDVFMKKKIRLSCYVFEFAIFKN